MADNMLDFKKNINPSHLIAFSAVTTHVFRLKLFRLKAVSG